MATEADGREDGRRFLAIDRAFRAGSLAALRASLDDPAVVPNGPMPLAIGPCLTYAIYHSPVAFIRELLDLGADPNAPADDGFPPLIAALSCHQAGPGAQRRPEVEEIVELLLDRGADPDQRGINDWTALHAAVANRHLLAAYRLLRAGADPDVRTRIDAQDTPADMAREAGLTAFADLIASRGRPTPRRLRSGLTQLVDLPGEGDVVGRQSSCDVRLRMWLRKGDPVVWSSPWGPVTTARLADGGATLFTRVHRNRGQLMPGVFYGMDGMRVGGLRVFEVAPHLGFGADGLPGVVPPNAVLTVEVTVLAPAQDAAGAG